MVGGIGTVDSETGVTWQDVAEDFLADLKWQSQQRWELGLYLVVWNAIVLDRLVVARHDGE